MRKNKKQRRIMLLLILILSITIGFALLSTTLKINGSASIKSNTWNIHWDDRSINVTQGSVSATDPIVSTITSTKDTVSFDVELELPGDYFEFSVDAINEGSIDGALDLAENFITYKSNNVETTLPDYMDFKVVYDDDTTPATGDVLKASESKTYKIRVEFKSSAEELPENPEPLTIEVNFPYVQHKGSNSPIVLPTGKNKNNLETGDEICINGETTECFNFIRYDENDDLVLLAKWNLKVGTIKDESGGSIIGTYKPTDPGYGLQSSEVRGWIDGLEGVKGGVEYSSGGYWNSIDNDYTTPNPLYGDSYPVDTYDPQYQGDPGFDDDYYWPSGYSIAYFVEPYKIVLERYGVTIKKIRVLTLSELLNSNLGCQLDHDSFTHADCPVNSFLNNTSFWLGTASADYYALLYYPNSTWQYGQTGDGGDEAGVRPVIVITKNSIN